MVSLILYLSSGLQYFLILRLRCRFSHQEDVCVTQVGLAVGLLLSLWAKRLIQNYLYYTFCFHLSKIKKPVFLMSM